MKTVARLTAAVVGTVVAYVLLGVAGLWGVAFAVPALIFAPSAVRSGVREARTKRDLNAELAVILGGRDGHR